MNKRLVQWLDRLAGNSSQHEVEEELKFHIDMQARDYEAEGLTPEESLTKAGHRFGDFAQVKSQCVEIALRNSAGAKIMKVVFMLTFILGVLIRNASSEMVIARVGTLLIMISVLGGLLLLGKKLNLTHSRRDQEPLRLGIVDSSEQFPRAFDEKGRTPFERLGDID